MWVKLNGINSESLVIHLCSFKHYFFFSVHNIKLFKVLCITERSYHANTVKKTLRSSHKKFVLAFVTLMYMMCITCLYLPGPSVFFSSDCFSVSGVLTGSSLGALLSSKGDNLLATSSASANSYLSKRYGHSLQYNNVYRQFINKFLKSQTTD